jgi:hypothetical protein
MQQLDEFHGPKGERGDGHDHREVEQAERFHFKNPLGEGNKDDGNLEPQGRHIRENQFHVCKRSDFKEGLGLAPAVERVKKLTARQRDERSRPPPADSLFFNKQDKTESKKRAYGDERSLG